MDHPHVIYSVQEYTMVVEYYKLVATICSLVIIQGTFVIRVCAVHNNNQKMKWILSSLMSLEIILVLYGQFGSDPYNPLRYTMLVNVPILAFECLLLALLLYGLGFSRTVSFQLGLSREQRRRSLLMVVLRDGCLYFMIVTVMAITDAISQWYPGGAPLRLHWQVFFQNLPLFFEAVLGPRIAASLLEAQSGRDIVYLVPY